MHRVVFLRRFGQFAHRMGLINVANLFGPEIVFGHEHKAPESPQKTRLCDPPAGFLKDLAMQCRDGAFSRINTAPRQLEFVMNAGLIGQENLSTSWQNSIRTGPGSIRFSRKLGFSVAPHACLPFFGGCSACMNRIFQRRT
jgi:hypothetical protein